MDWACKLLAQNVIDQPLPGDPRKSFKRLRNHSHAKMGFAAFPRAGMTFMEMRFIRHLQTRWR